MTSPATSPWRRPEKTCSRGARALVLVAAALVVAAAWTSTSAGHSALSCDVRTGHSTTVRALARAVVQPADLPRGWRFERTSILPKGTSADGPSSHRLGGAVTFAHRAGRPDLSLTSSAELEPSASAACRTYHRWLRSLLGAGVGARRRAAGVSLGRERALLESNETAFGPMVSISWYRGAVYAEVQVQFRGASASVAAHRAAVRLASASDLRLQKLLQ